MFKLHCKHFMLRVNLPIMILQLKHWNFSGRLTKDEEGKEKSKTEHEFRRSLFLLKLYKKCYVKLKNGRMANKLQSRFYHEGQLMYNKWLNWSTSYPMKNAIRLTLIIVRNFDLFGSLPLMFLTDIIVEKTRKCLNFEHINKRKGWYCAAVWWRSFFLTGKLKTDFETALNFFYYKNHC